jgi:probable HAF family extracellular repeat protein
MHPLPTLGGPNGYAYGINDRGEVAGLAENSAQDPGCPVHQFVPVVWKHGQPTALSTTAPGELYGMAQGINEKGQLSGASGVCSPLNPDYGLYVIPNHAMLWDADGTPHELPGLGGIGGLAGNHACALNNRGQAVGHSLLPDNNTFHAVLWPDVNTNKDLGTLPEPYNAGSLALSINDSGQVVGTSFQSDLLTSLAFIWENDVMTDLNHLVSRNPSGLTLAFATSINDDGEIIGLGVTSTNEVHGFLAIPSRRDRDDR